MILGDLHQDLLRGVIEEVPEVHPTGLVGCAGVSRKPFKYGLLFMWAVFDAGYVARDLLPTQVFG